ncbi:MAG: bifunctional methionine sulfoxide reductase B/A protein [Phycisphaerales bacterium]|nr:bifunctional methionine sulfoxide reductase B/A protein [Phycisphaerales bacterium]
MQNAVRVGVIGAVVVGTLMVIAMGPVSKKVEAESMNDGNETMKAQYSQSGHDVTRLSDDRISELATKLNPEEAKVILKSGTEPAFCGTLLDNKKEGVYLCRLCDLPLFASGSKFTSGTGWPSFFQPVDELHVLQIEDNTLGMRRVEIECQRCGGHLGHVFPDGPEPTGLRFCLNSVSLSFVENGEELPAMAKPMILKMAYFAGGCFWGIEDAFEQIPGVTNAVSGYQGGSTDKPGYYEVSSGQTGHAESVEVTFDPKKVSYDELLTWFFKVHNPTQGNRQGPDVGSQYRSVVFAMDDEQLAQAQAYVAKLAGSEKYKGRRITTEIRSMSPFFAAEERHQDYHAKNGGSCALPTD